MKFKKVFISLFVCLSIFLSACGNSTTHGSSSKKDSKLKELNYIYVHTTNTLNPHLKGSSYIPLRAGVVETLFKMDNNSNIAPWLINTYSTTDCINWIFTLKSGIKFHNGTVLDANMVKQNLESIMKHNPGIAKSLDIKSINADGLNLNIITNSPNSSLPSEFVHPNTAIIDMTASDIDKKPMGTGPFKVEKFTSNTSINLVKNENYWDGTVKLDRVNFQFNEDANARLQALQSGYADAIFKPSLEAISLLKSNPKYTIDSISGLRTHKILYNVSKEPISHEDFRKGIDCLINRKEIVDTIMAGQATVSHGPFMEQFPFAGKQKGNDFNTTNALEFFKKAGFNIENNKLTSKDGKPIKLKMITYSTRPELPQIAQLLQDDAKKVGLELEIQLVENADKYMSSNTDWDMAIYSLLTSPRGDAGYYLNASFLPDSSMNFGKINDSELINTIKEFNISVEEADKLILAKKATAILTDKQYNSYIAYPNVVVAYNKNRVLNWTTVPSEYYMITKDLDVK